MMPLEEYGDLIFKGTIAFFVVFGWAIILYPYFRKHRKPWYSLCGTAAGATFGIFLVKELVDKALPVFDELLSYALGIFFAIVVIAILFLAQQSRLNQIARDGVLSRKHGIDGRIPLRHILQVSMQIEEQGKIFYANLAESTGKNDVRELCLWLSKEEEAHRELLASLLGQWLPRPVDQLATSALLQKFHDKGIFLSPPGFDSGEEVLIQYALQQEYLMAEIYATFEEAFPEIWKRLRIQQLMNEELKHAEKINSWKKNQKSADVRQSNDVPTA